MEKQLTSAAAWYSVTTVVQTYEQQVGCQKHCYFGTWPQPDKKIRHMLPCMNFLKGIKKTSKGNTKESQKNTTKLEKATWLYTEKREKPHLFCS